MDDIKEHWEDVWTRKKSNQVSWYQEYPKTSIELILSTNPSKDASIIDVGSGDSNLVEKLLDLGFSDITVLDISAKALERAKERLGKRAEMVKWLEYDIREFDTNDRYDIWHDRALLHFLTSEEDLKNYAELTRKHVKEGGYVILSTFSTNGPMMCSGLDTKQFSEESMKKLFSNGFEYVKSFEEEHKTPFGVDQIFIYTVFRKK
ncbi:MAG: class I SAM-dependent methyltransferase [Candidatus Nitrosotenuis sp.]|nr:MAG: class I SAM-dependent methyltransferase [Candidatus Nitrosotenuis sp.]